MAEFSKSVNLLYIISFFKKMFIGVNQTLGIFIKLEYGCRPLLLQ